jgi:hypothetical protein
MTHACATPLVPDPQPTAITQPETLTDKKTTDWNGRAHSAAG